MGGLSCAALLHVGGTLETIAKHRSRLQVERELEVDVFGLRQQVIGDYASCIGSFFKICDERIRTKMDAALTKGHFWPDPLLQLSSAFEPGETTDKLTAAGEMPPETRKIFALKWDDGTVGASLRLHRHHVGATRAARAGGSYVVTTGTN